NGGCLAGLVGRHTPAVAHYGDAARDAPNLVHAMAYINDTDTFDLKRANIIEKPGDLGVGQGGGWFVEDEELAISGQGAGDLDQLLMRNAKVASRGRGVQFAKTDASEGTAGVLEQIRGPNPSRTVRKA